MSSRESARRFHFLREVATGGFGTVYLAKVMHADGFSRLVAVKLLKSQWTDNEDVTRRIRDEARLLGLLRHRNIVDVIDLTSIDGRAAVVMEYLEAADFRTVATWLKDHGGRMPVRAALEAMAYVASALDAAYNRPPIPGEKPLRVIHRDIKPSNIMVDETGMVKVLDFGVARSELENRESFTQELQFGSVDYMAPERLFFEPETPASDIYSLGASLFEILALDKLGKARGRPEKHAAYIEERFRDLREITGLSEADSAGLESLLRDALEFAHEARPSAADFFQRARSLARQMTDADLGQWAELVLPPVIRMVQDAPRESGQLADAIVPEDSVALSSEMVEALGLGGAPPSAQGGAQRGDQLRRGALAELEDSKGFVPTPATGAPAGSARRARAAEPVDSSFEEFPTRIDRSEDVYPAGRPPTSDPTALPDRPPAQPVLSEPPEAWDDVPTRVEDSTVLLEVTDANDEPTLMAMAVNSRAIMEQPTAATPPQPGPADPFDVPEPGGVGPLVREKRGAGFTPVEVQEEPPPLPVFPPVPQDLPSSEEELDNLRARAKAPTARGEGRPLKAAAGPAPIAPPPSGGGLLEADEADDAAPEGLDAPPASPPGSDPWKSAIYTEDSRLQQQPISESELPAESSLRRRSALPLVLAIGCLGFLMVVGGGGLVLALDVGGLRTRLSGGAEVPEVAAPTPPVAPPVAPPPPEPSGPVIKFVSAAAGTSRLNADCAGETAGEKGSRVVVPVEAAESCLVTAVLEDRSRLRATVNGATAGTWRCFADGASECVKE